MRSAGCDGWCRMEHACFEASWRINHFSEHNDVLAANDVEPDLERRAKVHYIRPAVDEPTLTEAASTDTRTSPKSEDASTYKGIISLRHKTWFPQPYVHMCPRELRWLQTATGLRPSVLSSVKNSSRVRYHIDRSSASCPRACGRREGCRASALQKRHYARKRMPRLVRPICLQAYNRGPQPK